MVNSVSLLRNVGAFDSVTAGRGYPFDKLALIYAENGRGKSTVAAIMRSVSTGDPNLLTARKRLNATGTPHVVINRPGIAIVFQDNAWNNQIPEVRVFDEQFVAENVHSGMAVDVHHRRKLHDLIIGAEGVRLNQSVQLAVDEIERLNSRINAVKRGIPVHELHGLDFEAFIALPNLENIETEIVKVEDRLRSAQQADKIRAEPEFPDLEIPDVDLEMLGTLLQQSLAGMEEAARSRLEAHFKSLGAVGESWVRDGYRMITASSSGSEECPFCAQRLDEASILDHYQLYFSDAYEHLKQSVAEQTRVWEDNHGSLARGTFDTTLLEIKAAKRFWGQHLPVPEAELDASNLQSLWQNTYEIVRGLLEKKGQAPLEICELPEELMRVVNELKQAQRTVKQSHERLRTMNLEVHKLKASIREEEIGPLSTKLNDLKVTAYRHSNDIATLCNEYKDATRQKGLAERKRDSARQQLEQYRNDVFPRYEEAINSYLERLNAGFRLTAVAPANDRGGSTCNYSLMINEVPVRVSNPGASQPTFKDTLSTGDRNTLALAFFFAALDNDPKKPETIVVIDDPMTSLDAHRSRATIRQIKKLTEEAAQVIVLSHSKRFLCELWEVSARVARSACQITRYLEGSTFSDWDVKADSLTEHDRRYAMVDNFIKGQNNVLPRAVAEALRPIMESTIRILYPTHFTPGSMVGQFIDVCNRALNESPIISAEEIDELRDLIDYANGFHHDTNPAYQPQDISTGQLLEYCKRTLALFKPRREART